MTELEKDNQKKQTAALFINTTQEMIDEQGLEALSIRKIAERAGFHNSTIYLHFKDLDELLMLASMKHFHVYSQALEELSKKNSSPTDTFLSIWELFCDSIFENPDIFYNFFHGKRSKNLEVIMRKYYDIFPDERNSFSEEIEYMYFGNNIDERSLRIIQPLISEDTAVTKENVHMLNDITVSFCKYKLEQKCQDKTLNNKLLKSQVKEMLLYICGIKR